jgi:DNA polymerase
MSEDLQNNLADLIGDVAGQLSYMRGLGVEMIEASFNDEAAPHETSRKEDDQAKPTFVKRTQPQIQKRPSQEERAGEKLSLLRNALAASKIGDVSISAGKQSLNQSASTQTKGMATKSKVKNEPSMLGDLLFGDITPSNELPESNETLKDIHNEIGDCKRCGLCEGRAHIVHSEGSVKARLMFIGEAPGADEDAQARPFVGRAGQLLNKIIEAIGMKREEVFIGNINRCRPPGNRAPTTEEAETCKPFLMREIAVVRPDVIVVMGNTAMKNLLGTKEGITKLRGEFQDYHGVKVMPTFHPAYLLRDPSKKRETWDDMKKVRDYLKSKEE